ncbi:MAG: hypothetical protein IPP94_16385 [Ignavibacteria bacterium]|nr:hypothetical protein [Ignavibacteria bacterium]
MHRFSIRLFPRLFLLVLMTAATAWLLPDSARIESSASGEAFLAQDSPEALR